MRDWSRTNAIDSSLHALFLPANVERSMRNIFDSSGSANLSTGASNEIPLLDFANIYISRGTTQATYERKDILALEHYSTQSVELSLGTGRKPNQDLYDAYGIVYAYCGSARLHVIGVPCMLRDGSFERRTVICCEPPSEVLFVGPTELFALATASANTLVRKKIVAVKNEAHDDLDEDEDEDEDEDGDEDEDDDDDDDLEFEEDEPEPLPASKPQVPTPRKLRPKKVVKRVPVKPVKKVVAKRPAMRLVKPFDPTL